MGATEAAVAIAAIATRRVVQALLETPGSADVQGSEVRVGSADAVTELVRERLTDDPTWASTLNAVEEDPASPAQAQLLQDALVNVVVMDDIFAGKLERLVSETNGVSPDSDQDTGRSPGQSVEAPADAPVRGFIGLTAAAASPQTTAGSDFSIFVLAQNPFNVPVTIYQVQTHIPVELIDVNRLRVKNAELIAEYAGGENGVSKSKPGPWRRIQRRRQLRDEHPGVAVAVGTEFTPEEAGQPFRSEASIGAGLYVENGASANFSAVSFFLPAEHQVTNLTQ